MSDHHDEAEAYRNRAERAEQEAAELREVVDWLAERLQMHVDYGCTRAGLADRDALAAYTLHMIR